MPKLKNERYNLNLISGYVIDQCKEFRNPINGLKISKLIFYSWIKIVIDYDVKLFDWKFKKWDYGANYYNLYELLRIKTNTNMDSVSYDYNELILNKETWECETKHVKYDIHNINIAYRRVIREVVKSYLNYKPWDIIDKNVKELSNIEDHCRELDMREVYEFYQNNYDLILGDYRNKEI